MCGATVRDETLTPTLVGAVGFSLAAFFYLLKMMSAIPKKNGRQMGWDDWAITATVLLTVPPTVFAFLRTYFSSPQNLRDLAVYECIGCTKSNIT